MSEGILSLAGTVDDAPLDQTERDPDRPRCSFFVRTTPSASFGDREPVITHVMAFRGLAQDVLGKVQKGDKVLVQGRLGARNGRPILYAQVVAVDIRSLDPFEVDVPDDARELVGAGANL